MRSSSGVLAVWNVAALTQAEPRRLTTQLVSRLFKVFYAALLQFGRNFAAIVSCWGRQMFPRLCWVL
jgi:hypothetical protein